MVVINGRLNGSITGLVRATPDVPFVDSTTSPPTLIVSAYEATITAGVFTITVPQSQNLGNGSITYKWELFAQQSVTSFYLLDGTLFTGPTHQWVTDSKWYTGTVHDTTSRLLDRVVENKNVPIQQPFHAIAPDSASPVSFTSLQGIPSQTPWFDIGLARLADMLTTVALYRDRISAKFVVKGAYAANTTYQLNDVVTFNGNSYVYTNNTPSQNQQPPLTGDDANWLMIAAKGAPGGTGAQIVGYNATSWAGSAEAAARGDVRDAIASIPNPDLSAYLTVAAGLPRNNAVMTGTSKRAILNYPVAAGDRNTEIPTAQYVEDAIAAQGVGLLAKPVLWTKRITDQVVCNNQSSSGNVRVVWDSTQLGSANLNNGVFTVPVAGNYLFYLGLLLQLQPNSATEPVLSRNRAWLNNISASTELDSFFRAEQRLPYTVPALIQQGGLILLTGLSAGTQLEVRASISYTNGATAYSNPSEVVGSVSNNLIAWRVAN